MANEQIFNNRTENYTKGRPGYANGVLELLFNSILKPNYKIADVGSGTGIFAKAFIDRGFDVYCVEPNEEMRTEAKKIFAGNPHFISVAASAETTTLPEHSIDLITAASAFHWFDAKMFHKECQRILKPNGIFFAVANGRDYNDPFTLRQHEICTEFCKDFTSLRHGLDKSIPKLEVLFGSNINHTEFDFPLEYTKEKFVQRSLSSSYAPEPNTIAYQKYIEELWALMDEFAPNSGKIVVLNVSIAYWGELSE
ncbi:MAG: class I SAM-dependent methyltransferase [Eubacteriales bacterium]|nr:class I SAM-dependent methyltransferase [Eubacteriales bacterium]